ncbi:MAG: cytochrome c oxidase assembly protein, partial [Anaerolineales bacterium]|nr:cytochrome c oxidase assembly protein [Anaerolineales bacterium]
MATPATIWRLWPLDGWLISGLLLAGWLYGRAVFKLRRRTSNGRLTTTGQIVAFYSGLTVLALALMSPLEALSALLFSAHMGQHL